MAADHRKVIHRVDASDTAPDRAAGRTAAKHHPKGRSFAEVHAKAHEAHETHEAHEAHKAQHCRCGGGRDCRCKDPDRVAARKQAMPDAKANASPAVPPVVAQRTPTLSERGERLRPVPGHSDFAEIMSGPRNGLFLNISGNSRDGEAFVLVHRHGRTFHVYDIDGRHVVIGIRPPAPPPAPATPPVTSDAALAAVTGGMPVPPLTPGDTPDSGSGGTPAP